MQYDDGNLSPLRDFFRNKWVRIFLIIDVFIIIILVGIKIWQSTKVSVIEFNIAPIDATISVNGNTNYSNGQYSITPGTYEIKISHKDLEPKTMTVNIEPHQIVPITLFLTGANNNLEFYELNDNYKSFEKLQSIASANKNTTTDNDTSAEKFIPKLKQKISIFDKLPIKGYVYANPEANSSSAGFTIRSGQNTNSCEKTACLIVNYYGRGYQEAVAAKIKEAGYNPADYEIVFERYDQ